MNRQKKNALKINRMPKIDEDDNSDNIITDKNHSAEKPTNQIEKNILTKRSSYKIRNHLIDNQKNLSPSLSRTSSISSASSSVNNGDYFTSILKKEEKENTDNENKQPKVVRINTDNLVKRYNTLHKKKEEKKEENNNGDDDDDDDDDDEFDWFEEDDLKNTKLQRTKSSIRRAKKQKGGIEKPNCWHYLTPYMKRFILHLAGSFIFIICAVLFHFLLPEGTVEQQNDPNFKNVSNNLQLWFWHLAFMWNITWITSVFSQLVPSIVRFIAKQCGGYTETAKTYLLYYVDVRSYVVVLFISAWNVGIWVLLLNIPYKSVKNQSYSEVIREIFAFVFFSCIFLLVQKLISVILRAKFFHVAYAERVAKSKSNRIVLETLNKAIKNQRKAKKRAKENLKLKDSTSSSSSYFNIFRKKDSFTSGYNAQPTIEALSTTSTSTSQATTLVQEPISIHSRVSHSSDGTSIASSTTSSYKGYITSKVLKLQKAMQKYIITDTPEKYRSMKGHELGGTTKHDAKKLAKKLFYGLAYPNGVPYHLLDNDGHVISHFIGNDSVKKLRLHHFRPYFKSDEETFKAYEVFDADSNGDVTRREFRDAVVGIYEERRLLCEGLQDTSQALGKVDIFIFVVFLLIDLFVSLLVIFKVNLYQILLPVSTFILGLSFMFAETAKVFFQSVTYLFLTHPYDVGDKVKIKGKTMFVTYIGILGTTFIDTGGVKIYAPTTEILKASIINVRRSTDYGESITVNIDFRTPTDTIFALTDRLTGWVESQPRDFTAGFDVRIQALQSCNKVELTIWLPHKYALTFRRSQNRNRFMFFLKDSLHDLNIHYQLPAYHILSHSVFEGKTCKSMMMSDVYDEPTLHKKLFKKNTNSVEINDI